MTRPCAYFLWVSLLMVGCGGGKQDAVPDGSADAGVDTPDGLSADGLSMFTAWERARAALRKSPDHLPGRADSLVAAGDLDKLFQFVRDEIITYPPADDSFYGSANAQRWGLSGTLRGGAGTPREKAELLVSLYKRAGYVAEVVAGRADATKLDGRKVLLRNYSRTYAPPISPGEAAAWRAALGHDGGTPHTLIDRDGGQALALATSLLALLPAEHTSSFDFTLGDIPLVRVKVDNTWKFANPIAPGALFGDPVTSDDPGPVSGAYPAQKVTVRLEAARADAPYTRFPLLTRAYDAADVVGRRIHIGFTPPQSAEKLQHVAARDVETLIPVLTVSAPSMTAADRDRLAVVGEAFSRGGDRYALDASGTVTVNGKPLAKSTPGAVDRVASVGVTAEANAFPRMTLRVSALDDLGKGVAGLGADALTIRDNGRPVSFSMTQNESPPPKVVLLFDSSTSVPDEFRGPGAVTVAQNMVEAIYTSYPNAQVRVGTIFFGVEWMTNAWATTKAAASAQAAALATAKGGSEIWEALSDAQAQHPTLIVFVSDGDAADEPLPKYRDTIAAGVPVLCLGVGTPVTSTLDTMASLSGGTSLKVTQQIEAEQALKEYLGRREEEDYLIAFTADPSGPVPRSVTVAIHGKMAQVPYTPPVQPTTPPALSGLYLTLRVGDREFTRAVAGFSRGYTTAAQVITKNELDDVTSLLFGRISIAVEAASPPAAVVLDDWLAEKGSLKPLWTALESKDEAAIAAALHSGIALTPSKLLLAQPPLRDATSPSALTFETGLRLAAMVQKARDGKSFTRELDLPPTNQWATAADDPRMAWVKTFTATAGLAVMEQHLMKGTSTAQALAGQALKALPPGQVNDQAGLSDAVRLRWAAMEGPFGNEYTLLAPHAPLGFWAVHKPTGTLVGILPDGAGGAAEDACATYDMANSYLQLAGLIGGVFGVSIGGWVALAQWEVKYVTIATIVISGGTPGGSTDLSNPALDMGCGMIDDALGDAIPGLGTYEQVVGTLDTIGVDTGAPTVCGGDDGPC